MKYIATRLPNNEDLLNWIFKHFEKKEKTYYGNRFFQWELKDGDILNIKLFFLTSRITIRRRGNEIILINKDHIKKYNQDEFKQEISIPSAMWIKKKGNEFFIHCSEEMMMRLDLIIKNKFKFSIID